MGIGHKFQQQRVCAVIEKETYVIIKRGGLFELEIIKGDLV
jgi:hypothetical protein